MTEQRNNAVNSSAKGHTGPSATTPSKLMSKNSYSNKSTVAKKQHKITSFFAPTTSQPPSSPSERSDRLIQSIATPVNTFSAGNPAPATPLLDGRQVLVDYLPKRLPVHYVRASSASTPALSSGNSSNAVSFNMKLHPLRNDTTLRIEHSNSQTFFYPEIPSSDPIVSSYDCIDLDNDLGKVEDLDGIITGEKIDIDDDIIQFIPSSPAHKYSLLLKKEPIVLVDGEDSTSIPAQTPLFASKNKNVFTLTSSSESESSDDDDLIAPVHALIDRSMSSTDVLPVQVPLPLETKVPAHPGLEIRKSTPIPLKHTDYCRTIFKRFKGDSDNHAVDDDIEQLYIPDYVSSVTKRIRDTYVVNKVSLTRLAACHSMDKLAAERERIQQLEQKTKQLAQEELALDFLLEVDHEEHSDAITTPTGSDKTTSPKPYLSLVTPILNSALLPPFPYHMDPLFKRHGLHCKSKEAFIALLCTLSRTNRRMTDLSDGILYVLLHEILKSPVPLQISSLLFRQSKIFIIIHELFVSWKLKERLISLRSYNDTSFPSNSTMCVSTTECYNMGALIKVCAEASKHFKQNPKAMDESAAASLMDLMEDLIHLCVDRHFQPHLLTINQALQSMCELALALELVLNWTIIDMSYLSARLDLMLHVVRSIGLTKEKAPLVKRLCLYYIYRYSNGQPAISASDEDKTPDMNFESLEDLQKAVVGQMTSSSFWTTASTSRTDYRELGQLATLFLYATTPNALTDCASATSTSAKLKVRSIVTNTLSHLSDIIPDLGVARMDMVSCKHDLLMTTSFLPIYLQCSHDFSRVVDSHALQGHLMTSARSSFFARKSGNIKQASF